MEKFSTDFAEMLIYLLLMRKSLVYQITCTKNKIIDQEKEKYVWNISTVSVSLLIPLIKYDALKKCLSFSHKSYAFSLRNYDSCQTFIHNTISWNDLGRAYSQIALKISIFAF